MAEKNNITKKKIKKIKKDKRVCILTLGCPKNIVDSEKIMSSFIWSYTVTKKISNADVILLNTCGFLRASIAESFDYIKKLDALKEEKPYLVIIVFGCMVSRLHNEGLDLHNRFKNIDYFIPYLDEVRILEILEIDKKTKINVTRPINITSPHYAYLKISDGCNRKCSFCVIPNIKGKYTSVKMISLLVEAKKLVERGTKEIILIGQETTNYGLDIGTSFYDLLRQLSMIEGLEWIRIMYCHPKSFDLRILDLMNERPNICRYIDIPLQHMDKGILKLMKRGYTKSKIYNLINTMREKVPDLHIRSTFITGFPSENEQQHQKLKSFLRKVKFERVGVFKYSKELNTPAYYIDGHLQEATKQERFDELMSLQQQISLEHNKNLIGKTVKVLVEAEYNDQYFIGRSEFDAPDVDNSVFIEKNDSNNIDIIGKIAEFTVFHASEYDIYVR